MDTDMVEQCPASWASLSASFPYSALYTPPTEAPEIPLHLLYGIENTHGSPPSFEMPDPPAKVDPARVTQSKPLSPINSPSATDGHSFASPESSTSREECDGKHLQKMSKDPKRAAQNREAQRRFRERKEQHNKSLQQRANQLQEKYDALEERFKKQADELSGLQGENERLRRENGDVARRWRIMGRLLQQPKSQQVLAMFLNAGDDLDGCMRCLDALVSPD